MATPSSPSSSARAWAFFKERSIFWLSVLIALAFLLIGLYYQTRQDVDSSRYAIQRLTPSDPPIEIIYPQHLFYESSNKPGAPLIARLPDAWLKTWENANAPTVIVPLTFVSNHLMFTDAQGNPTSGQLVLSNATISQTIGTLYIRPKPIIESVLSTATLGVILPPHTFTQPFDVTTDPTTKQSQPIFLETQEQSYWRNFLNHLLSENALALAVGVALVGGGVDWLWRQREREQKEREFELQKQQLELNTLGYKLEFEKAQSEKAQQELAAKQEQFQREIERQLEERRRRLPPIREMMPNNPAYALKQFLTLEEEANKKEWDQSLRDALEGFRADFVRDSRVRQQVMQQAGEALSYNEEQNYKEILKVFNEFFNRRPANLKPPSYESITILLEALERDNKGNLKAKEDPVFPGRAHTAALQLWEEFDDDVRDLLRPLLCSVYQDAQAPASLLKQLDKKEYKRLVRDPDIRETISARGLKADHWDYNYDWRQIENENEIQENSILEKWLQLAHLKPNPFGRAELGVDSLLGKAWVNFKSWDLMQAGRPLVVVGLDPRDCAAAAKQLLFEIRTKTLFPPLHDTTFPAILRVPFAWQVKNVPIEVYYEQVVRALSETWCELLAQNVDAYLELDSPQRVIVAELLLWSSKDENYLASRLKQAGLPDDPSGRMLLRRLHESIASAPHSIHLSHVQLEGWLRARPNGLSRTFLIVIPSGLNNYTKAKPLQKQLAAAADIFCEYGIYLKLFTTEPLGVPLTTIPIEWQTTDLVKVLDSRIAAAATEQDFVARRFSDRFDSNEKPVDVETFMADYAHGSLNRMLDLGNLILQARVNRGGITNEFDFYLTRRDLCVALNEYRRMQ